MIDHRITDHKKKKVTEIWISFLDYSLEDSKYPYTTKNCLLWKVACPTGKSTSDNWMALFSSPSLYIYILYIQIIYSSNLSLQYIFVSAGTDVKHIEFREEWQFRFKHQKDSGKFSKIFKIFQGITIHIG